MRATRAAAPPPSAFPPWRFIGVVLLGGTAGTGLRETITLLAPGAGGVSVATVAINVVGAFLLGVLLEHLARGGPDVGRRRNLRLLLGAGGLGGFTTYSALATDTVLLWSHGSVTIALLYSLGTLLGGVLASWAGIAVAARRSRHRKEQP
jgi:fluoride exporter